MTQFIGPWPIELCEWWPDGDGPATGRPGEQCERESTLIVGTGHNLWHLCDECSALPRFNRLRRREPRASATERRWAYRLAHPGTS